MTSSSQRKTQNLVFSLSFGIAFTPHIHKSLTIPEATMQFYADLLLLCIVANTGLAFTPATQVVSRQQAWPCLKIHCLLTSPHSSVRSESRSKSLHQLNLASSSSSSSDDDDTDRDRKNMDNDNNNNDEIEALRSKAEELRDQIRKMEEKLQSSPSPLRSNNNDEYINISKKGNNLMEGKSLKNKRVLVVGANGRLGSMITRYLLRNHPEVKEVVAAVHYVGQATTRGYGRLSYEVGAEDGVGTIGAAWSPEEERNARFEFSDEMKGYNLQNLVSQFGCDGVLHFIFLFPLLILNNNLL